MKKVYKSPFTYPAGKQTSPYSPKDRFYRDFKQLLRREFKRKCIYCCKPDVGAFDSFGVDHYKPKTLFPKESKAYRNLYYACNSCNRRKGDFWPSSSQCKDSIFIPNPRDHSMAKHLRFKEGLVLGSTKTGKFTVETLDLNEKEFLDYRSIINANIDVILQKKQEVESALKEINKRLKKATTPELLSDKAVLLEELKQINKNAFRLRMA